MKSLTFVLLLSVGLFTAGCGYHPLYATGSDGRGVADSLAGVSIPEADTRAGQLVRNNLLSTMRPAGTAQEDRYKLVLIPVVTETQTVDQTRPGIERKRLKLAVSYDLVDLRSGTSLTTGKTFSDVSYDIVHQPVADLQAQNNATGRAAQEVGTDIRTRLAAYLASAH